MKEINTDIYISDLENEYMDKHRIFKIENSLLNSFSKDDLTNLIKEVQHEYLKHKLLYISILTKRIKSLNFIDDNGMCKYFIEQINYYFNWWKELEESKKFLDKLNRFYRLNFTKQKYKSFKSIDINSILIEDVLSMYIDLTKWRIIKNIKCPLHIEKTASFKIYKNTNSWYCFWCKKWGNAVDFISEMEDISKREAFKKLIILYSNYLKNEWKE